MFKFIKATLMFLSLLSFFTVSTASEKSWEEAYSEIEAQVESAIAREVLVSFSAYEIDANQIPVNNLNEVVVSGKIQFLSSKGIWRKNTYISKVIENPTWLDITVLANKMIIDTQDTHHVFLEDIEFLRMEKDIKIYDFVMGS